MGLNDGSVVLVEILVGHRPEVRLHQIDSDAILSVLVLSRVRSWIPMMSMFNHPQMTASDLHYLKVTPHLILYLQTRKKFFFLFFVLSSAPRIVLLQLTLQQLTRGDHGDPSFLLMMQVMPQHIKHLLRSPKDQSRRSDPEDQREPPLHLRGEERLKPCH